MTPTATATYKQRSASTAERAVVVYDGDCAFCRQQIQRFQSRDIDTIFEYVPRQERGLEKRFPQLAGDEFNTGMRLVHLDGSVSVGADAVYQIARRIPGWKNLAWIYRLPGLKWLLRTIYAWIARNRYRLTGNCQNNACLR